MAKEELTNNIKHFQKQIDNYILIRENKAQFNKDKAYHCKNLKNLLEESPNFIKHLNEEYKEKLTKLNFFYVDKCLGPVIKVDPRKYG